MRISAPHVSIRHLGLLAAAALVLSACSEPRAPIAGGDAAPRVRAAHAALAASLPLDDRQSFEDADRGFIARPGGQVRNDAGDVIWDYDAFAFLDGPAPDTVNPSLWRQALLNNRIGLFEVTEGIWQLRGFDLANISLIAGDSGWIVVDAGTSRETAAAALAFARQHLGDRPVSALIFTHSHADHFGGALGVISAEEAAARQVPIIAPSGFMDEATSENVLVGTAMARRAMYMYGSRLPRDARGLVDNGLGKAVAFGRMGILPPTLTIESATEEHVIDGVRFVFHDVPGSEAPSELVFAVPERRAFNGAEVMGHTLHNLHTLRGAKVRDALRWAGYLDAALAQAADAEVLFNQHHWPVWGQPRIQAFIRHQRDAYRYIHDQTVRLMNAGLTAPEIAETLRLPAALERALSVRGYYGTVRHNVRAVYQHYLGWFDAHPANLDPLPPVEAATRYVALAGGRDKLLAAARAAFDGGEFRWASELLKHAVHADADDREARELLARSLEQLGYLAEATSWRNFYLSGAFELRNGTPERGVSRGQMLDLLEHVPIERFLGAMAASLDGPAAEEVDLVVNLVFSDLGESHVLRIENAVLHHRRSPPAADADATLTLTRPFFLRMLTGGAGASDLLLSDETQIEGSRMALGRFFGLIEKAPGTFPIVTR